MADAAQFKQIKPHGKPQGDGSKRKPGDRLKWMLFWALVVIALVVNVYYQQVVWSLRAAAGVLLVCVLIALVFTTAIGENTRRFIAEARAELRKVVWPTRAETIQTALMVVAMVVVVALVLWGLDALLIWGIRFLTQ